MKGGNRKSALLCLTEGRDVQGRPTVLGKQMFGRGNRENIYEPAEIGGCFYNLRKLVANTRGSLERKGA